MIWKIYFYLGWIGLASIVTYLAGFALAAFFFLRPRQDSGVVRRRVGGQTVALAVTFAGLYLAWWCSDNVALIEREFVNPMDQIRLAQEQQQKTEAPKYAYQEGGKKERAQEAKDAKAEAKTKAAVAATPPPSTVRILPEEQYEEANYYDQFNLNTARTAFTLVLLAALYTYWASLRTAFSGGGSLGEWLPSGRTVCLRAATPHLVKQLLERLARSGETFIYFGDYNPRAALAQDALEGGELTSRQLRTLTCGSLEELRASPFLFNTVWYGYGCAVFTEAAAAREARALVRAFLEAHRARGERAAATLNVVWDLAGPPDDLAGWAALCRAVNARLILATPQARADELGSACEETFLPIVDLGLRIAD